MDKRTNKKGLAFAKPLIHKPITGGWYRVRTCDPCRVKAGVMCFLVRPYTLKYMGFMTLWDKKIHVCFSHNFPTTCPHPKLTPYKLVAD